MSPALHHTYQPNGPAVLLWLMFATFAAVTIGLLIEWAVERNQDRRRPSDSLHIDREELQL
jgi:hypothetical protein